jgi:hypothetical protein
LRSARVTCLAGASLTPTVLGLEVAGVLTSVRVAVSPSAPSVSLSLLFPLNYALAAASEIRWVVVSGPGDVTNFGLTLVVAEAGTALEPAPTMTVRWVNGAERFTLFTYDPDTHLYAEASAGISTGRATIANATDFEATIEGDPSLVVSGQTLSTEQFVANGGTADSPVPRLEWMVGSTRVGTLTKSGRFSVVDITETASPTAGSNLFAFYSGGVLVATLGVSSGLAAKQIEEPI